LNPVVAWPELDDVRIVKPEAAREVDILVVRENLGGVYQGETRELPTSNGGRVLEHRFYHPEAEARRFLAAAARLARQRRGQLTLVHKAGGLPQLAGLWKSVGEEAAAAEGVEFRFLDIDFACYLMLQEARTLDVLAAPNCFADILSDLGGILMGGRGLTFGSSYGSGGEAVYQTNHGAAYDLQGTGKGNPLGQILSMSMMLRESFRLVDAAEAIEAAVRQVVAEGVRTGDIATAGGRVAGTAELTERIVAELEGA
jgi:3-isopropylmalate dehydrogenase